MSNDLIKSLSLMILGMVGIYVVILLIYVVIILLNRITNDKPGNKTLKKEEESDEDIQTEDNSEDEEICAVIQAVMCEELHVDPDQLRVIKITAK